MQLISKKTHPQFSQTTYNFGQMLGRGGKNHRAAREDGVGSKLLYFVALHHSPTDANAPGYIYHKSLIRFFDPSSVVVIVPSVSFCKISILAGFFGIQNPIQNSIPSTISSLLEAPEKIFPLERVLIFFGFGGVFFVQYFMFHLPLLISPIINR